MFTQYTIAAQEAAESATPTTLLGALSIAITVLAGVCVFLFMRYDKRNDQIGVEREGIAKERAAAMIEREKVASDHRMALGAQLVAHEQKQGEMLKAHAAQISELHRQCRDNEDKIRREFADMIENMQVEQTKATGVQTAAFEKLIDRVVVSQSGPKR